MAIFCELCNYVQKRLGIGTEWAGVPQGYSPHQTKNAYYELVPSNFLIVQPQNRFFTNMASKDMGPSWPLGYNKRITINSLWICMPSRTTKQPVMLVVAGTRSDCMQARAESQQDCQLFKGTISPTWPRWCLSLWWSLWWRWVYAQNLMSLQNSS